MIGVWFALIFYKKSFYSGISRFNPNQFFNLSRLTHLDVSYNSIITLPALPDSLQVLNVSHNSLISLDFAQPLLRLRALHAQFNRLETIPKTIVEFTQLQSIKLNDNKIFQMPNLQMVSL